MIAYTYYPTDSRIRREAETLVSSNDFAVTLFVPKNDKSARRYQINDVNLIELGARRYRGKSQSRYILSYIHFLINSFFACTRMFIRRRLDIVHIHNMPNFLVFSALLPRLFGKTVILDMHDTVPETYAVKFDHRKTLFFKLLCFEEKICCMIGRNILCVNHVQRDLLINRGIPARKIAVFLNVPDHKIFKNAKRKNLGNAGSFDLVYHGILSKRSGIDIIIRAVERLISQVPDIKFNIIGEGDDAFDFQKLTKKLELEEHVFFKGLFPTNIIPDILSNMDIGVVANRKNIAAELMLPVKMLEYMALNIPVVAPRLKTIQYYFSDKMITYFEPENIESLTQAILALYSDQQRRENQARMARGFIDQYGWEKHHLEFLSFYREA